MLLCSSGLAIGCVPPESARSAAPLAPAPSRNEFGAGFRSIEATGQGLELDLPDADGWRHDARDGRSFVALHAATRSRLLVRAWSAGVLARPSDCEQQLRQLRPELPSLAPEEVVEERSLRVAGDHAASLTAGVVPSRESATGSAEPSSFGYALLFASHGRQCLALVYSTSATGGAAFRIIGERLGAMTRITFERVRRLGIEARVRVPRR